MIIKRDKYLNVLVSLMHNGMIKVITGLRRSGKSFLLFNLFFEYLKSHGVKDQQIIRINLDEKENIKLRNIDALYEAIKTKIKRSDRQYYILLDEIQYTITRDDIRNQERTLPLYDLLNSFLHLKNVDIYVTGSNSKFLSKDVMTEFRGRGWPIKIQPLAFSEFFSVFDGTFEDAFNEYLQYGGLPFITTLKTHELKTSYLDTLFKETYLKDIEERYNIKNNSGMEELINVISSSIGSLTNPQKIAKTFQSNKKNLSEPTITNYLQYLEDVFLIEKVQRYDIKGRKYIGTPSKYYFSDLGLRNARLNFRQVEKTHLMENLIYNELIYQGYNVDVGVVPVNTKEKNKNIRKQYEVDFVTNHINKRYYIQSALNVDNNEKLFQEQRGFIYIPDGFKRIIITENTIKPWQTEEGTLIIGIKDFLLKPNSLEAY